MGGERETLVEKEKSEVKVAKGSGKTGKTDIGSFRIHESKGEVHVHDDTNKLKAAVPVAAWWKMWDKLRNEPGTWTWIDPDHKTRLSIQSVLDGSDVDVIIGVSPTTFGDAWNKLNSFTKKK